MKQDPPDRPFRAGLIRSRRNNPARFHRLRPGYDGAMADDDQPSRDEPVKIDLDPETAVRGLLAVDNWPAERAYFHGDPDEAFRREKAWRESPGDFTVELRPSSGSGEDWPEFEWRGHADGEKAALEAAMAALEAERGRRPRLWRAETQKAE